MVDVYGTDSDYCKRLGKETISGIWLVGEGFLRAVLQVCGVPTCSAKLAQRKLVLL